MEKEEKIVKEKSGENGPYRATKLWNNVVQQFRKNMPTGKHRRNMRVYDHCFVASDAVDWLHDYLMKNQDFGENVSRYQTVQLLQKFTKARVFEDVRSTKHSHQESFQDNGRLYKFVSMNSLNSPKKRNPLKDTMNTDSCSSKSSPSTPRKPRQDLNFTRLDIPKTKASLPPCRLVEKSLSKEQIDKIWKTVTLARLQKLLGKIGLHDLVDTDDVEPTYIIHNTTYVSRNGVVSNVQKEEHLPQWIMSAMRCLAHWPNAVEDSLPSYPGFEKEVFRVVKDYFQNLEEPLITYELYDIFCNVFLHAENPRPWKSTPRHPMGMSTDSFISMQNLLTRLASPRPLSNLNLSCIAHIDSSSRINQSLDSDKSEPSIHETMYITAKDETYYDNFAFESGSDRSGPRLRRFYSTNNVGEAENYLLNGQDNIGSRSPAPPRYKDPPPYRKLLKRTFSSNSAPEPHGNLSRSYSYGDGLNATRNLREEIAPIGVERMIELLQVCCLFLPPANRRKLHLLLRLMYKMERNEKLQLGTGMSIRSTVLETFYRAILLCVDETFYDDQVGLQLVAFMVENHEQIMVVPARLKQNVETRIAEMQRIQIQYGPLSPAEEVNFCQRVSVSEYERQKRTNSEEALFDLLETIVKNEKMSDKERRRRLKQFQKVYPEIYLKRFPGEGDETKNRKPLFLGMTGALTKLKSIRF